MGAQVLANGAPRERRARSRRRGARSGRGAPFAPRKCHPQTGERHFKKGGRYPRDQSPGQRRAMITLIAQNTGASIRDVCQVLELPRSTFYHAATPTATQAAAAELG